MRMSCRDEDVDKCDGVDLLCATRSRSNLHTSRGSVGCGHTGKRLKYRVQTFGCGLTSVPHEGPGNHSVLVNLDAGARSAAHRHDMHQRPHEKKVNAGESRN